MRYWLVFLSCIPLVVLPLGLVGAQADIPDGAVARVVYFYPRECESCEILYQEVIESLMSQCGTALEVKKVEIGTSAGYEAFLATEKALTGKSGVWDIPVAVLGSKVFIGEETIREGLESAIKCAWLDGGNEWPPVPELEAVALPDFVGAGGSTPFGSEGDSFDVCVPPGDEDSALAVCESPQPIFALYFYDVDCQECDRISYDLRYITELYPQVFLEERDITENAELARWLAGKYGADASLPPAVVIGDYYLQGAELTPDNLLAAVSEYADSGTTAVWKDWEPGPDSGSSNTVWISIMVGVGVLVVGGVVFLAITRK